MQQLDPSTAPRWGKMSVQHMIEHYAGDALRSASGRLKIDQVVTPPEKLRHMQEFLMSDRAFKENTRNPLLGEEPRSFRYKTIQGAIGALQQELIYFFEAFEKDASLITTNPFLVISTLNKMFSYFINMHCTTFANSV